MKAKICSQPGCSTLIVIDTAYCEKHKIEKVAPFKNAVRTNEHLYNTARWRKLRNKILKESPNCSRCGADANLQVHHRTPPRGDEELFFDENNLTPLCESCHRVATAKEIKRN
jgi:5-methylcytosine-specific restriction protein A